MDSGLERAVVVTVIGSLGVIAAGVDLVGLWMSWQSGGLLALSRALSAVGLGWMCGWYLTARFQPTSGWLRHVLLSWAGHIIAAVTAGLALLLMALLDLMAPHAGEVGFFGLTAVTFAPVASYFATQLSDDRSVHLVSGFGIGALTYVVLVGLPG